MIAGNAGRQLASRLKTEREEHEARARPGTFFPALHAPFPFPHGRGPLCLALQAILIPPFLAHGIMLMMLALPVTSQRTT